VSDEVRLYGPADRGECLRLFDGNVPAFFAAGERAAFEAFLDQAAQQCAYRAVLRDGRIVACGGHALEPDGRTVSLCWGMVDPGLQRTGIGTALTLARLEAARSLPGTARIRLDTSQHTQGFYARFGFEAEAVTQDGYAPGLDRWEMILNLRT
jgi:ribosomal protein S18 acetylase RimI-like enzyme